MMPDAVNGRMGDESGFRQLLAPGYLPLD